MEKENITQKTNLKNIPTRLGSLVILLFAVIAGSGIWGYEESYTPPDTVDVSKTVKQIQERREVKEVLPKGYRIKGEEVYYQGWLIDEADPETFVVVGEDYSKDVRHVFYKIDVVDGADPLICVVENLEGCKSSRK